MEKQSEQVNRFSWQQTMLRVKDYKKSVEFYTKYFGMTVIDTYDFPQWKFSLYFLGTLPKGQTEKDIPTPGTKESHDFLWNYEGVVLELTYNYGTETDDKLKYHPGNTTIDEKTKDGFGHVAFHCDDVYELCEKLEKEGIKFQKKPDEGKMKGLAFALDPDGYWVEIIKRPENTPFTGQITFGQTMLRVKDAQKSIKFYTEICQMTLINERHFDTFSLYFLATLPKDGSIKAPADVKSEEASIFRKSQFQPVLELTHNHGTEGQEDFTYLNGNTEPYKGFGHIGFLVDDVYAASAEMEKQGVLFQKKPDDGAMKGLAFAKDPDGYWIELVKRGTVF